MSISFSDKMKIMKILSTEEGREKFKETLVLKLKSQKAQEATAKWLAEGLAEFNCISVLEISCGGTDFLPLKAKVTADGEVSDVMSIQPDGAEFDYVSLCEEFNTLVADNDDEKAEFMTKTAKILQDMVTEKGIGADEFSVKII